MHLNMADRSFTMNSIADNNKYSREKTDILFLEGLGNLDNIYNHCHNIIKDNDGNIAKYKSVNHYDTKEFILSKEHIIFIDSVPYIYRHGLYMKDKEGTMLKTIIEYCCRPEFKKAGTTEQIYKSFKNDYMLKYELEEVNMLPDNYINFKNGILNLKTLELEEHSPEIILTNQIPHEYTNKKSYSKEERCYIDNFLNQIVPNEEDREMLLQYIAYCLTFSIKQEKMLMIKGISGTGKSVLLNLIMALIGSDNVANIDIKAFQGRFAASELRGKLLNCCSDIDNSIINNPGTIKLLSGNDTSIRTEQKGKSGESIHNYSKQIWSCNQPPLFKGEVTNAIYRRFLMLKINQVPEKVDIYLIDKLISQLPYFITLVVESGHNMFNSESGQIAESDNSKALVRELRNESDILEDFLTHYCILEDYLQTSKTELYNNFTTYCDDEGIPTFERPNKKTFYHLLNIKGYATVKNSIFYFKGIGIRKEYLENN